MDAWWKQTKSNRDNGISVTKNLQRKTTRKGYRKGPFEDNATHQ